MLFLFTVKKVGIFSTSVHKIYKVPLIRPMFSVCLLIKLEKLLKHKTSIVKYYKLIMTSMCVHVFYQRRQKKIRENAHENNNAGCDKRTKCWILKIWTTWGEIKLAEKKTLKKQPWSAKRNFFLRNYSRLKDDNTLAMAQIMAKAAKLPASPWPLMIGVVYEAGSNPAIPKRLPCNTAPKAVENKRNQTITIAL